MANALTSNRVSKSLIMATDNFEGPKEFSELSVKILTDIPKIYRCIKSY